jgi:hypothetical protein
MIDLLVRTTRLGRRATTVVAKDLYSSKHQLRARDANSVLKTQPACGKRKPCALRALVIRTEIWLPVVALPPWRAKRLLGHLTLRGVSRQECHYSSEERAAAQSGLLVSVAPGCAPSLSSEPAASPLVTSRPASTSPSGQHSPLPQQTWPRMHATLV